MTTISKAEYDASPPETRLFRAGTVVHLRDGGGNAEPVVNLEQVNKGLSAVVAASDSAAQPLLQ